MAVNLPNPIATTPTGGNSRVGRGRKMKSKKNAKSLKKVKKIEATKNLNVPAWHHR